MHIVIHDLRESVELDQVERTHISGGVMPRKITTPDGKERWVDCTDWPIPAPYGEPQSDR